MSEIPSRVFAVDTKVSVDIDSGWQEAVKSGDSYSYGAGDIGDNLVPIMTSHTTPSGVVTQSIEDATYAGWRVFNGETSNYYWHAAAATAWVAYEFPQAELVNVYGIANYTTSYIPKTWTFEGSNDGTSWDILDSRSDIVFDSVKEYKYFSTQVSAKYNHYRLNMTEQNTGTLYAVSGLSFHNAQDALTSTRTYNDLNSSGSGSQTLQTKVDTKAVGEKLTELQATINKVG